MKILAVVPARGGSKRVPKKNIRNFCGKPLLAWSIEAAFESRTFSDPLNADHRVAVTTDDAEVAAIARGYAVTLIERPAELATDTALTAPVLVHAVDTLSRQGYRPDVVVLLQPTVPTREAGLIDECVDKLVGMGADCLLTVSPLHFVWWRESEYLEGPGPEVARWRSQCPRRPRRQDMTARELMFAEDGAVFVVATDFLERTGTHVVTPNAPGRQEALIREGRTIDIDTEEDFLMAEVQMARRLAGMVVS
jgi:CMP-N,N'-diacetyllegionaminic acid synthase